MIRPLLKLFLKTFTYKCGSTLVTLLTVLFLTGDVSLCFKVSGITVVAGILFYILHEKLWSWHKKQ